MTQTSISNPGRFPPPPPPDQPTEPAFYEWLATLDDATKDRYLEILEETLDRTDEPESLSDAAARHIADWRRREPPPLLPAETAQMLEEFVAERRSRMREAEKRISSQAFWIGWELKVRKIDRDTAKTRLLRVAEGVRDDQAPIPVSLVPSWRAIEIATAAFGRGRRE